jgi:hypothetical protein
VPAGGVPGTCADTPPVTQDPRSCVQKSCASRSARWSVSCAGPVSMRSGRSACCCRGASCGGNMSSYWPAGDQQPDATPAQIEFARNWRDTPKVVFSSRWSAGSRSHSPSSMLPKRVRACWNGSHRRRTGATVLGTASTGATRCRQCAGSTGTRRIAGAIARRRPGARRTSAPPRNQSGRAPARATGFTPPGG